MTYKKQEMIADFSDKIAISKMAKDASAEMEKAEAMKFNVFLKKCIPTKSGTDKEKFGACLLEFKNMKKSDAGRPGPKSGAQTPAKPEERKKGSDVNKPGSAGTKSYAAITFSEKTTLPYTIWLVEIRSGAVNRDHCD